MKRWAPLAYPGPDGKHRNANPSLAQRGSWQDANGYQQNVIEEPSNLVEASGFTLDENDDFQLARAVRSQRLNYFTASGTANALTVAMNPVPANYIDMVGTPLRIKIVSKNTGAATLAVVGLTALPIVHLDGTPLSMGDLLAGAVVEVICTGTSFALVGLAYTEVARPPTGAVTLYVRTDGSDANDGSANTAAKAFLTLQRAIDYAHRTYAPSQYDITIQLADGTYGGAQISSGPALNIIVRGNMSVPANVQINAAIGSGGGFGLSVSGARSMKVQGIQFINGTSHLFASNGASISFDNCRFGAASHSHLRTSVFGLITGLSNYVIFGDALFHMTAADLGFIQVPGLTVTLAGAGTRTFTNFADANSLAQVACYGTTFIGSANGKKYQAQANGVIYTAGGGVNLFPGSVAGTVLSGGQYV